MAEETPRRKTRSASICAPGFSSIDKMVDSIPPSGAKEKDKERERDSGSGTPEGSTPTRRRRPATRSQSARVTGGGKSIRRRAAAQGNFIFIFCVLFCPFHYPCFLLHDFQFFLQLHFFFNCFYNPFCTTFKLWVFHFFLCCLFIFLYFLLHCYFTLDYNLVNWFYSRQLRSVHEVVKAKLVKSRIQFPISKKFPLIFLHYNLYNF